MNSLIRLILNFLTIAIIILFFRYIGWIHFQNIPQIIQNETFNIIIIAGLIGLVMFIIGELASLVFKAATFATCGLGCILYPVFNFVLGYIKLYGTQMVFPGWFTFEPIWWKVLIISFTIGLFRIPSFVEKKVIKKH